jgi:hypothetical protein
MEQMELRVVAPLVAVAVAVVLLDHQDPLLVVMAVRQVSDITVTAVELAVEEVTLLGEIHSYLVQQLVLLVTVDRQEMLVVLDMLRLKLMKYKNLQEKLVEQVVAVLMYS